MRNWGGGNGARQGLSDDSPWASKTDGLVWTNFPKQSSCHKHGPFGCYERACQRRFVDLLLHGSSGGSTGRAGGARAPLPVSRQGSPPKPLLEISAIVVQEGGATVAFRGRRRGSLAFRDGAFRFWANDTRHDIGFRRCARAVKSCMTEL